MKKKLAIFDMDGTLFDTVPANQAAYAVALAPYGVSLSVEDFALHCNGRYYRDFLGELLGGDEAKIEAAKTFIDFIAADPDQVKDSVLASTYFPVRTSVGDIYADNEIMSEYSKFMAYLGDYYQITPGWATARTEWWNMLQRVGSGEDVETAVKTFVDNANAAAQA